MSNVWVEKFRPTHFDDIVLDPLNKKILKNVITTGYFPNLLFYGPPGTGKTTTIINLINAYQEAFNQKNKELMIHLNASDERGIDIIRSQINQFVNSKTLFSKGTKFVILDEVDYMTKTAQQALRYLLQNYCDNVRFCLICNYISRIDEGLQNEFLRLRFNQLPENDIVQFLAHISETEQTGLSQKSLMSIQKLYKSDIRSMINFMQSNQDIKDDEFSIIDDTVWENLFSLVIDENIGKDYLVAEIGTISRRFSIEKKNIIKDFFNYIIRNYPQHINPGMLDFVENIVHFEECNNEYYISYALIKLASLLRNN